MIVTTYHRNKQVRGWPRALVWASVEIYHVEGQPEVPFEKFLTTQDNLILLFCLSIDGNMKKIRVAW